MELWDLYTKDRVPTDQTHVRWLSPAQIKELLDGGKLVPTLRYFFDRVDGQM